MADKPTSSRSAKAAASRDERLKAALKANLARRKAQSRVRAQINDTPERSGQDKDT